MRKKQERKKTGRGKIPRAAAILLSCSLALAAPPCGPGGHAAGAEAGQEPQTAERRQAGQEPQTAERRQAGQEPQTAERPQAGEAGHPRGTAPGEKGFSYRLRYGDAAGADATGRRRAGGQEPWAEITAYSGAGTEITIPGTIDGKEVKSIGKGAFKGNMDITRVTIAEGITSIGHEAFSGCGNLEAVSIPSTIASWDDAYGNGYDSRAFEGCTALRELTLAEGLGILGQKAFSGCTALEEVALPSTIAECHNQVFSGCTALKSLELREGIREIGYQAFAGCTSLEEADIPSTIERWGKVRASGVMSTPRDCAPFLGCASLKRITLREGLETLNGFQGCRECPLVTEIDIPASVEDTAYAFTDCTGLEKVNIQEGPERIGEGAFRGCTGLREMLVPDTVASVGATAFKGCTSLERLVLPASVTELEGSITAGCSSLKELYLLAESVKWYQGLGLASGGVLYCLEGSGTYGLYRANMPEGGQQSLAPVPPAGAGAEGCTLAYDGEAHAGVEVKGTEEGDIIRCRMNGGSWQEEVPEITEPGTYSISVTVKRFRPGEPMKYSSLKAVSQIRKRQHSLHLPDVEAEEGEPYEVAGTGYGGTQEPAYCYYRDEACQQACGGKPEAAGVYYVRAEVPETDYDAPVKSNVAKITIRGKNPGNSPAPGGELGSGPGSSPSPDPGGTAPGSSPAPSPGGNAPGNSPAPSPGGTAPGNSPSPNPGGNAPGNTPGTSPSGSGQKGQDKKTAKAPKIKKVSLAGVKPGKRKATVRWKKVPGASGYQVQAALNRKFTKGKKTYAVKKAKATKKTIRKLRRKKKYFVRARAYRSVKGRKYYGSWSRAKSVKVK